MKKITTTLFSASILLVSAAGSVFASPTPPPVPEPGTLALFGLGAAGLILYKKIRK